MAKFLDRTTSKLVFRTRQSVGYRDTRKQYKYLTSEQRGTIPGSIVFSIPSQTPIGPNCSSGGYWITTISPQNIYPLSQYTDAQCNYYMAYTSFSSTASYQKFDSSGQTSIFSTYETFENGEDISEIFVDPLGNLYVCYGDGIRKTDSSGDILWEKYFQNITLYGVSVNSIGEIFINGENNSGNNGVIIAKLDSEGIVLAQKELVLDSGNWYAYTGPKIDSQDNVIWSIPMYDESYSNLFVKFDSDLNFIWDTRLDPTNQIGDYDVTEFGIDSNNNIYANHYYNTIAKYDSNGDFIWARALSSSIEQDYVGCQGLGVTENGDVFYLGPDNKSKFESGDSTNVFYITKINSDGDLQYISYISSSLTSINDASWNYAQAMTTVKSNAINVCFQVPSNYGCFAKLPLTQVPDGQYGDFYFIDITNNPNLELQPFTNTSRISTNYTLENTNAFDTTFTKTYITQTATGITIANTIIE